jgi:hypothetical protein
MVMFSVMISIPILNYDTYFSDLTAYDTGLIYLENTYSSSNQVVRDSHANGSQVYQNVALKIDGVKLLLLKIDNNVLTSNQSDLY